ncbi:MAG: hypothetical protein L0H39_12370, partial [Brachybacterium sp.]|nr:hypothetical protein [Brachybacterium sp.]
MAFPLAVAPALAEMTDGESAPPSQTVADDDSNGEQAADGAPSAESDDTGDAAGIVAIPPRDDSETAGGHDDCTTDPVPHLLRENHKDCDGDEDDV